MLRRVAVRVAIPALLIAAAISSCANDNPAAKAPSQPTCPSGQGWGDGQCVPLHPTLSLSASPSETPSVPVAIPTSPPADFPPGYPKVVSVSSLPSQVRNWYRIESYTQAVAV